MPTAPNGEPVTIGQIRRAGDFANGMNNKDVLPELEGKELSEQLEIIANRIELETRIKDGADKILQLLDSGQSQGKENLRKEVEAQLAAAKAKIAALSAMLDQIRASPNSTRTRKRTAGLVHGRRQMFATAGTQSTGKQREEAGDKDDFKTALNQARQLIQLLVTYQTRYQGHLQPSPLTATTTYSPLDGSPGGASGLNLPPMMNERDMDRSRTGIMTALVTILQRNLRVQYELDVIEVVRSIVPALADYASKESRAAAYRLIRHILVDMESIEKLRPFGLDWFMVRSLARDNKHAVEKEQVIKLIRAHVEVGCLRRSPTVGAGSGDIPLSEAVLRALIAVAEHPEDQFRAIALETLAEILLIDIDLLFRTEGLRPLLQTLVEGPHELSPTLASAFLYLVDAPRTRVYFNPGLDLEIALTGFTDSYGGKGGAHAERMQASSKVIATMLRSWSGLMYLCHDGMVSIRSIIDMLRVPSLETENREVILDMFFDVLKIDTPDWYQAFIDGRRLTVIGARAAMNGMNGHRPIEPSDSSFTATTMKLNLAHHYISLLILVFLDAGLVEGLVAVLEELEPSGNVQRKATLLLGEILQISNRVLPLNIAADVQSLPRLFELASDINSIDESRRMASSTLSSIDSFNRHRARLRKPQTENRRPRANSIEDTVRRNQRQVEQVKMKLSLQIDDKAFQDIVMRTQVISQKDATKWNLDALFEVIEGPLMNPKRLEEAFRVLKFGKRLLSFFHPFSNRFSSLKITNHNNRFIKLGCALLTTMVSCPEGVKYLANEDPLLKQLVDCFNQLDPFNPGPAPDPIFSKERVSDTISSGYFEMLGTLSKYPEGIELLERFKIFTSFYHLSELRSREDLIRGIIENMDYTSGGHARIVLSKALTSSYMHVRLFATTHLGQLIRSSVNANEWTLRLLITQLYDPAVEVCELAVQYLEEACESMEVLELVVQMQPTLDHLGEIGHPLLLKFMSTQIGFRFLYKSGYIDREMEAWFHERNYQYLIQVEVYLAQAFSAEPRDEEDEELLLDGTVPPHFYGEMAKTDLGCQVLSDKGHFAEFAHFIRQHGLESEDFDLIGKLKSVLWAVGNIGSTTGGLPFLEEEGIVPDILAIATESQVLSARGTAFFVLGLISSTVQGAELLDEYGWESTLNPLGETTGLCVPADLASFVTIPSWQPIQASQNPIWIQPPDNSTELQILTAVGNLQNTVIANEAARSLTRMKAVHRALFSSVSLFYRVLHMLSTHRYRLPVRRYVLDLFDIDLDPDTAAALFSLSSSLHRRPTTPSSSPTPSRKTGTIGLGVTVREPKPNRSVSDTQATPVPAQTTTRPRNASISVIPKSQLERSKYGTVRLAPKKKVEGFSGNGDADEDGMS